MGHSEFGPDNPGEAAVERREHGRRKARAQAAAGLAIRFWLDGERRLRDRALFDLAIDGKLRGCDIVKIRIGEFVSGGKVRTRATVMQQKTGRPDRQSQRAEIKNYALWPYAAERSSRRSRR